MNMQSLPILTEHLPILCWRKGAFHISTDRRLLDADFVRRCLRQDIDPAALDSRNLCFGLYRKRHQLGFARVVTDYATRRRSACCLSAPNTAASGWAAG